MCTRKLTKTGLVHPGYSSCWFSVNQLGYVVYLNYIKSKLPDQLFFLLIIYQGFGPITVEMKLIKPIKCTIGPICQHINSENEWEGYEINKPLSGLLVCQLIMPFALEASLLAKYSFFGQSFSRGHYQPTYQPPKGVYLLYNIICILYDL